MRISHVRRLLTSLAVCSLVFLCGCIQQTSAITVNADGTGTLSVTVAVTDKMGDIVSGAASAMGAEVTEDGESDGGGGKTDVVGSAKKNAARYPAEWNTKVEEYKDTEDGYSGATIIASFKDAEQLKECFEAIISDAAGGSDGKTGKFTDFKVLMSGDEDEIWTFTVTFTLAASSGDGDGDGDGDGGGFGDGEGEGEGDGFGDGGSGDSDGEGADGMDSDGDGLQSDGDDAAGMAMAGMMADMKIVFSVTMPTIVEATCTQTAGGSSTVGETTGNTATFEFRPMVLGMMNSSGEDKVFEIKVVGSTEGGDRSSTMIIIIALLALVVLGVVFFVVTKRS